MDGQQGPYGPLPTWDLSPTLRGITILFVTLSTLIIVARLYSRAILTQTVGLDDAVALAAWIVVTAESSVEIASTPGTARAMVSVNKEWLPEFFQLIFAAQMLYLFAVGLIRLSIVAFLPRLNHFDRFRNLLICVAVFIITQTLVFFAVGMALYKPSKSPIQQVPKTMARTPEAEMEFFDAHQGIGLAIDLFLLATPLWIIYSNLLQTRKNINVILIFSVGVFEIAVDIIRLLILRKINHQDGTSKTFFFVSLLTTLELHVGLWVSCFPPLVPMIRNTCQCILQATGCAKSSDYESSGPKPRTFGKKDISSPLGTDETALTDFTNKSVAHLEIWDAAADERPSGTFGDRKVDGVERV